MTWKDRHPVAWVAWWLSVAVLIGLWILDTAAQGATYYTGLAATGDQSGSDANNLMAWASVSGSTSNGDTIYIRGMTEAMRDSAWPSRLWYSNAVCMYDAITWTFDQDYRIGQFANRDIWVVGPCVVSSVSPAQEEVTQPNPIPDGWTGEVNGSQVNPGADFNVANVGSPFGLDERIGGDTGMTYAVSFPLTLDPNDSLISADSIETSELPISGITYYSTVRLTRPALLWAAVLTCVGSAPAETVFRPSYCGDSKVFHKLSDVNLADLPDLAPLASTPVWSTVSSRMQYSWLPDYQCTASDYLHPKRLMPNYPGDMADQMQSIAVLLLLDDATMEASPYSYPSGWKQTLAIRLIQFGIDSYGIAEQGGGWSYAGGGFGSSRYLPIMLAGKFLNYAPFLAAGTTYGTAVSQNRFGENQQTFIVTPTDVALHPKAATRTNCRVDAGSTTTIIDDSGGDWQVADDGTNLPYYKTYYLMDYWALWDIGGAGQLVRVLTYSGPSLTVRTALTPGAGKKVRVMLFPPERVGYPDWGCRHGANPSNDWHAKHYRFCCTSAYWAGQELVALALDLKTAWAWDAFFDYTDQYMQETYLAGTAQRQSTQWVEDMWDDYRADYGTIYTAGNQPMTAPAEAPDQVTPVSPADEATDQERTINLTWLPSGWATGYDVYVGATNPPTVKVNNQAACSYAVTGLEGLKTYYWRIDSKNSNGTTAGVVRSFTTESSTAQDFTDGWVKTIAGASNCDINAVAVRSYEKDFEACDGSRVTKNFGSDYFTGDVTAQWTWYIHTAFGTGVYAPLGMADANAAYDTVSASGDSAWAVLDRTSSYDFWIKLRLIEDGVKIAEVATPARVLTNGVYYYCQLRRTNWTTWNLSVWTGGYGQTLVASLDATSTHQTAFDQFYAIGSPSGLTAAYKVRLSVYNLDVWLGDVATPDYPDKTTTPYPAHLATDVPTNVTLTWSGNADWYNVYYGPSAAYGTSLMAVMEKELELDSALLLNTGYYWRVDAVDSNGVTEGDVWRFQTSGLPRYHLMGAIKKP